MPLKIATGVSTAQAREIWAATASACRDRAPFSHMVVTFRGRRKGNLVFWWPKVDFSSQVQGIGAVLLRSADFVAGAALCMDMAAIVKAL